MQSGERMNKANHEELFERSKKVAPGGVHSPVRSFKGLPISPRFMQKADGAYIYDVEGKSYIDFCMSFGPLILGHRDPLVAEKIQEALTRGWSYGACEPYSLELAEFLIQKIPFIEKIRFVNSGTEAVMTAIRLARGFTGRSKIIKFNGCYHGHLDAMLIKAGSGLAGEAEASSGGVPEGVAKDTLIVELDNEKELEACFLAHPGQIAGVIIEPLPANNGLLVQRNDYLDFLRKITSKHGALLIFDEVISGFRVGPQGMAGLTHIKPDLVTYGKVIGGGMPVGAVAGSSEIMNQLAPLGRVYQAGTLSANPLAMAAGLATLSRCDQKLYDSIEKMSQKFVDLFFKWAQEFNNGQFKHLTMTRHSSLFWAYRTPASKVLPRALGQVPETISEDFTPFFMELLKRGIYLAPNAYEVGFISAAHDEKVYEDLKSRLWS